MKIAIILIKIIKGAIKKNDPNKNRHESDIDSRSDYDRNYIDPVDNDQTNKGQIYHYSRTNKNYGSDHGQNRMQKSQNR